ncbi:MAG: hypothetical protein KUG59_06995 [Parvibaculaceae bacterium]|nr:hypothetical protein [Parvibaculaceae bacterium]
MGEIILYYLVPLGIYFLAFVVIGFIAFTTLYLASRALYLRNANPNSQYPQSTLRKFALRILWGLALFWAFYSGTSQLQFFNPTLFAMSMSFSVLAVLPSFLFWTKLEKRTQGEHRFFHLIKPKN